MKPIFICTLGRSGCHLLMSLINSTSKVGFMKEYFVGMRDNARELADEDILAIFEKLEHTVVDGRWGTKLDVRDIYFLEKYISLKGISRKDIGWIWLRRRDKIAQAISMYKATEREIWHIHNHTDPDEVERAKADIEIPLEKLRRHVLNLYIHDSLWERYFIHNKIKPYIVFYEDFVEEPSWLPLIESIFDFLGIPYTDDLEVSTKFLKVSDPAMVSCSYKNFINSSAEPVRSFWYD